MILIAAAAFLLFAPRFFEGRLNKDPYREWLENKEEPSVGVISVWHIVRFRPYVGSIGSWMKDRARDYADRFIGVYFDVKTYMPEDAAEQLARGNTPDIVSFCEGDFDMRGLKPFDLSLSDEETEKVLALPFCATGSLLVFDPNAAAGMDVGEIRAGAGSAEELKKGKAISCVCDIRGAGDLYRAQLLGKCPYFETVALDDPPTLQYIGVTSLSDDAKLPYSVGFIRYLTENKAQDSLARLGVIPVSPSVRPEYECEWLGELYDKIDASGFGFLR